MKEEKKGFKNAIIKIKIEKLGRSNKVYKSN